MAFFSFFSLSLFSYVKTSRQEFSLPFSFAASDKACNQD
jgi:hypothetical protein